MSGFNLPESTGPNDPEAPWNKTEEADDQAELVQAEDECECDCGWVGPWDAADLSTDGEYRCPVCDSPVNAINEEPDFVLEEGEEGEGD